MWEHCAAIARQAGGAGPADGYLREYFGEHCSRAGGFVRLANEMQLSPEFHRPVGAVLETGMSHYCEGCRCLIEAVVLTMLAQYRASVMVLRTAVELFVKSSVPEEDLRAYLETADPQNAPRYLHPDPASRWDVPVRHWRRALRNADQALGRRVDDLYDRLSRVIHGGGLFRPVAAVEQDVFSHDPAHAREVASLLGEALGFLSALFAGPRSGWRQTLQTLDARALFDSLAG